MQNSSQGARLAGALARDPQARIQPINQPGRAYAGGNPNFDERTGRFINQQPPRPMMGEQIAQGMPQQLQRVSPGVYRAADGSLVNGQGGALPQQPQPPQQPNQFTRDQFPGRQFSRDMMPQQPMNPWVQQLQPPPNWGAMQQGFAQVFNQPQMQDVNIGKGMSMQVPMPQQPQQNQWANAMQGAYQGMRNTWR